MRLTGKGSIEQLDKDKQPRYCRKWRVWQYAENRRYSRRVNGTYTQAQEELKKLRKELSSETDTSNLFSTYASKWLDLRLKNPDLSPNTLRRDKQHVKLLQTMFDGYSLSDIKPSLVQEKMNERGTRCGTTMNSVFVRLSSILKAAVDDDLIPKNPCDKVKPPKKDTKEKKALNKEEVTEFLDRLDALELDGRVLACYLMVLQGLRRSEVLALTENDVTSGITRINKALKEANFTIGKTKSKASVRDLPQPQRLQNKINAWIIKRKEYGFEDTFCCSSIGTLLTPQNLYKWYRRNFPDLGVTLHELRHTNLTMMARELSVFGLKYWAGWSSLEPARVYIHNDREELDNAVLRIDEVIS